MRRKSLGITALALVLAFVLPQGAVTGKKRRQRVTCDLAPFSYQLGGNPESRPADAAQIVGRALGDREGRILGGFMGATGSTVLTCPAGHRWNGAEVNVEVLEAKVIDDGGRLTGRAEYVTDIPIEIVSLSFMAKIRGTSSPDGNGGSTLDLSIAGRASNGTKLRLHEIGTFDQVTGELVSLRCESGWVDHLQPFDQGG